jgi:hypothetical protein
MKWYESLQGIQIMGISPRNMRARVISAAAGIHGAAAATAANYSTTGGATHHNDDDDDAPYPAAAALTLRKAMDLELLQGAQMDVILAVEQPDGEKVICEAREPIVANLS